MQLLSPKGFVFQTDSPEKGRESASSEEAVHGPKHIPKLSARFPRIALEWKPNNEHPINDPNRNDSKLGAAGHRSAFELYMKAWLTVVPFGFRSQVQDSKETT